MAGRWADLVEVTNDKGPYKLARFKADNHEFVAQIFDPYGIQGNPPKGSQAFVIPVDHDEGKMLAFVMPPPKDRVDQQKTGEMQIKNHVAGQSLKLDESGNIAVNASGDHTEAFGGEHTETIGGDKRVTTGGIIYINC